MTPLNVPRKTSLLLLTAVLAACGATGSVAPSPSADATHAASPSALSSTPAGPSADPTPDATPEPIVLGGSWVRPRDGEGLTFHTTRLSARPTGAGDGVTVFTKVVFWAAWKGGEKLACEATVPDEDRAWSCKADLLALGIPPGKVRFSFDVHGAGVDVARSADGVRKVTYAVPPPKPTKTSMEEVSVDRYGMPTRRVRWLSPAGYADEFLVYETFECPVPSTRRNANKPCFPPGTPVDVSQLELLAKASGDARSVKVRPTAECYPSSILLRARNVYGKSSFAIVDSATVIWIDPDSNDTVC